jgi:hypothetical protein
MAENAIGCPYPIVKNPRGLFAPQKGLNQIQSDLLILILTNPGERVLMPTYGTPLRQYMFDQNDTTVANNVRSAIINAINTFEPRIVVSSLTVTNGADPSTLNPQDTRTEVDKILSINLQYYDPGNIQNIQNLQLEIPLAGS